MLSCSKCKYESSNGITICPICGYDESIDYEKYPTLQYLDINKVKPIRYNDFKKVSEETVQNNEKDNTFTELDFSISKPQIDLSLSEDSIDADTIKQNKKLTSKDGNYYIKIKASIKLLLLWFFIVIIIIIIFGYILIDYFINNNNSSQFSDNDINATITPSGSINTYEQIESEEDDKTDEIQAVSSNVIITPKIISAYAKDINGDYLVVSYSKLNDLDILESIYLYDGNNEYYMTVDEKNEDRLIARGLPSGEYTVRLGERPNEENPFAVNLNLYDKLQEYVIEEGKQIKVSGGDYSYELLLSFKDDEKYQDYNVSYPQLAGKEFVFMDGKNNMYPENTFKYSDKGTVYMRVAWELPEHDVDVHVDGRHVIFDLKENYNNGTITGNMY